jgi:hypothetical protein
MHAPVINPLGRLILLALAVLAASSIGLVGRSKKPAGRPQSNSLRFRCPSSDEARGGEHPRPALRAGTPAVFRLADGRAVTLVGLEFEPPYEDDYTVNGEKVRRGNVLLARGLDPQRALEFMTMTMGPYNELVLHYQTGDEWLSHSRGQAMNEQPPGSGAWEFRVFPRRAPTLELRVEHQPEEWTGERPWYAAVSVPNPLHRDFPNWAPESLPVTRRAGDLEVTVTGLQTGMEFGTAYQPATVPVLAASVATFRLSKRGRPAPEWEPIELTCSDATGNQFGGYEDRLLRRGNEIGFPMCDRLPADEVWNVRAEFSRYGTKEAKPDYVWSARGIDLAQSGTLPVVSPGFGINVVSVQPINAWGEARTSIRLRLHVPRPGLRIRFHAEDERGRRFERAETYPWALVPAGEEPDLDLELPGDVHRLNLTLEGFKSRLVEFRARPTRIPPPTGV